VLATQLLRKPANLVAGPFVWTPEGESLDVRIAHIKFGLPGTNMLGHEVLTDPQVRCIASHVMGLRGAQ